MNIKVYSREQIEKLIEMNSLNNDAIISFYDPNDKPVVFPRTSERVFTIALHDIYLDELEEYNLSYDTYFPEADKLADFIYKSKCDGLDIICQCEYGESRSTGCAAAISEHLFGTGISIFAHYNYYPNKLVFHKLMYALEEYKKRLNL